MRWLWLPMIVLLTGCGATGTGVPTILPTAIVVPTATTVQSTPTIAPTVTIAQPTATIVIMPPTQVPTTRALALTVTKSAGSVFSIHAAGFRPGEKLTVKMTTYDGGVCVSSEPDPSCFWERQADSTGTYDRTTPLDVVTTKGKHLYWIEGAQSGETNRVVIDLASANASVPTAVEAPKEAQIAPARSVPATSVPQVAVAPVVLHDYPANEVHSWMSGCTSGGGEDVCACILQKMRVEYTIQEFRAINEQYVKTGHFPPRIQQIVNACT